MASKITIFIVAWGVVTLPLIAEERSVQRDAMLRKRFMELESAIKITNSSPKIGAERLFETVARVPVRQIVKVESDELDAIFDSSSGSVMFMEVKHPDLRKANSIEYSQALIEIDRCLEALGVRRGVDMERKKTEYDHTSGVWRVQWTRRVGGYCFEDQWLSITFDETRKRIILLRDHRIQTPQCPTEPLIDEGLAMDKAKNHVKAWVHSYYGQDYAINDIGCAEIFITYPNSNWEVGSTETDRGKPADVFVPPSPCLVYSFMVTFKYTGTALLVRSSPARKIYVDAITGEIAGGL